MTQQDLFPETLGLPDINEVEEIVEAVAELEVLGGYSRSHSIGPDGEEEVERYIEKLSDYIPVSAIRAFIREALNG